MYWRLILIAYKERCIHGWLLLKASGKMYKKSWTNISIAILDCIPFITSSASLSFEDYVFSSFWLVSTQL